MLHNTKGIVLHSFKYGDSGIIARVLTRELGLQSYLVRGVRKSKSRTKAILFQPLTPLDMTVYQKKEGLQHIKEVRCDYPFQTIGSDIRKSAITVFLSEVLLKVFSLQQSQAHTFDYVYESIVALDRTQSPLADFHILFLIRLTQHLGFSPGKNYSDSSTPYFNLKEGLYQKEPGSTQEFLDKEESRLFFTLDTLNSLHNNKVHITPDIRKNLLQKTLSYYRFHMDGFKEVKSLKVLETVFA